MEIPDLIIWLWAFVFSWIAISNQHRLNLIDDRNKSKISSGKESTQQLSLSDFMEEE
tara:strand:+ start:174 stop:344 length:171 start_codon:yes stop_codon:yes gene_type:complete